MGTHAKSGVRLPVNISPAHTQVLLSKKFLGGLDTELHVQHSISVYGLT